MSPQQAAIKRATRLAQRAVTSLDAAGRHELARAYRAAADDLDAMIRQHAGPEDAVRLAQLRDLLRQVEARLSALGTLRNDILNEGLERAATYGARATLGEGNPAAMRVSDRALRWVQAFIADDGLQLSDRLWRNDRQAREVVTGAIERAVIEGQSAAQAVRDFLTRGETPPGELVSKAATANSQRMAQAVADGLMGPDQALSNAQRLFRTEINRAHGEAYMMGAEDVWGFAGFRYLLSPAHPEYDICDLYAAQNLHGLGAGVYPDRSRTPWPAHPNTLSFVEIVFDDEITAADRAGKETSLQALGKLAPEVRRGVLGKNKAEAFDAGELTTGMIRARWGSVRQRIESTRERRNRAR